LPGRTLVGDRPRRLARRRQRTEVTGCFRQSDKSLHDREEPNMRYKAKSIDALHIALGGLPNKMHVEVDPDIGVSAKTVGELWKLTAWPDNLVITTPPEPDAESTVKVSKTYRPSGRMRGS
jgi:hypothetical protein